jgi:predicted DNA-binding ribbon-helix-helix protein
VIEKHSVTINGHATSVSLEAEFWAELKRLAEKDRLALAALISQIDTNRNSGLSGALRVFVLERLKQEAGR